MSRGGQGTTATFLRKTPRLRPNGVPGSPKLGGHAQMVLGRNLLSFFYFSKEVQTCSTLQLFVFK